MKKITLQIIIGLALVGIFSNKLNAQGTAFTYQGRLDDGSSSAKGSYDLKFALFDASTNGNPTSASLTNTAVAISNGVFTVTLDFGAAPFTGNPQWLELSVRTNGAGAFTALFPRQPLTPSPYAIMAGSASNLLGSVTANQLSGSISLAQLPGSVVTNNSTGLILNGVFSGNGSGLSGLTATATNLPAGILTNNASNVTLNGLTTVGNLSVTLTNFVNTLVVSNPPTLNGSAITSLNASQIIKGTWTNALLNYAYKTFYTNYTVTTNDVVLVCTGTNQLITLLDASNFPPTTLLTLWSDNPNGSVIVTNATGSQLITVAGAGQGLAVYLGSASSPSNSVTLMVHGGHW